MNAQDYVVEVLVTIPVDVAGDEPGDYGRQSPPARRLEQAVVNAVAQHFHPHRASANGIDAEVLGVELKVAP